MAIFPKCAVGLHLELPIPIPASSRSFSPGFWPDSGAWLETALARSDLSWRGSSWLWAQPGVSSLTINAN